MLAKVVEDWDASIGDHNWHLDLLDVALAAVEVAELLHGDLLIHELGQVDDVFTVEPVLLQGHPGYRGLRHCDSQAVIVGLAANKVKAILRASCFSVSHFVPLVYKVLAQLNQALPDHQSLRWVLPQVIPREHAIVLLLILHTLSPVASCQVSLSAFLFSIRLRCSERMRAEVSF